MTFAYAALQWPMWVVWCFRADLYLSKLVALDEELTSLLERIGVSGIYPVNRILNPLNPIVRTVTTSAISSPPP